MINNQSLIEHEQRYFSQHRMKFLKPLTTSGKDSCMQVTSMDNTMRLSSEGVIIIEVADTGIGIEHDKIDNLFKPFSTACEEHHRNFGGTGLGLWISKVIIELMGGHINCNS